MHICRVFRKNGMPCNKDAQYEYNDRHLCEKHWNEGRLTWQQPHKEVVEARRRLLALSEIPVICEIVLKAVVRSPRMGYNKMAEMVHRIGYKKGHLTRAEAHQLSLLVVNTVKLNRHSTKATEHIAFHTLATMIQDICL